MGITKIITFVVFLSTLSVFSFGQSGYTTKFVGNGPPVGSCGLMLIYTDNTNGDLYNCWLGGWIKVTGSSMPTPVAAGSVLASSGTNTAPVYQTKNVIDVRDYGVKCDGSTNDTTAMNNAFAAAVAVGTSTGTAHVKIPAGICIGNFSIVQGKGLKIEGSGWLSTHLRSPNSSPAMTVNGLWYSSFSDMTVETAVHTTANSVFDLDGDWDGTHTLKVQFVSFRDMLISGVGTSDGQLSLYAFGACRQGGSAGQCSNLSFDNVPMSGASTAVLLINGFNALGNTYINGDIQQYTTDGIYASNSTIDIIGTTFEPTYGCQQVINGGYDIHTAGGSYPTHLIYGVRTEGWTSINAPGASIEAFSQSPAFLAWNSATAFPLNSPISKVGADGLTHLYCATTAGTSGGIQPTWPTSGTVSDGSVVWTEENYNTINNAASYNSGGSHVDATGSVAQLGYSATLGTYAVNSAGRATTGNFDVAKYNPSGWTEHLLQWSQSAPLSLYATSSATATSFNSLISIPQTASVGLLTRGGSVKLYLGDNLYEGTEGSAAAANYHLTTSLTSEGTFSATGTNSTPFGSYPTMSISTGGASFYDLFVNPTLNPGAGYTGNTYGLAVYPFIQAAHGTNYLAGFGTCATSGIGCTRTDKVTIDTSGNVTSNGQISVADGSFGSSASKSASACEASFGITTLSTIAATTDTTNNCLPANAIIDAVVYRITTTITTAASFTIGDATTAARFCGTQSTLTAGTTGVCFVQADQTGAAGPRQTAAAKVRVTSNVNPGAGAIRLIVYYHTWTAPTS